MQIGSGQSALSLSLLKVLGSPSAASPGTAAASGADAAAAKAALAKEAAVKAAGGGDAPGVTSRVPAAACGDSGGCTPPRGSFVDFRA